MIDLGIVRPGSTLRIPFSSFDKDDGSSITMTNYAAGDILVYKDGGTTERGTAGFTATTDFDSKTGKHLAIIDLAENTTADFWAAGSEYVVAIDAVTIDGVTVGGWIARFVIGYPNAVLNTTIATLASQTSFTLAVGPAEDDALNDMWAVIHDAASAVQWTWVEILDYTGSTKTVTLAAAPATRFTVAAKDNISIMFPAPLQPTALGTRLDVTATGAAGLDWGNVENPTTTVGLSGTTVKTATDVATQATDIQARLPAALTANGNIKADTLRVSGTVQTAGDLAALITAVDDFVDTEVAAILAAVDTEVAAIKAQTDKLTFDGGNRVESNVTLMANDVLTAAALHAGAATEIAAAVLGTVVEVEGSYTLQQFASIALAALAGRSDGAGTYKTPNNNATRIAGTVVAGARTAVTLTPSA